MGFEPVDQQPSFPALEVRVLDRWRERKIFARSLEARGDAPLWRMYEGLLDYRKYVETTTILKIPIWVAYPWALASLALHALDGRRCDVEAPRPRVAARARIGGAAALLARGPR